MSKTICSTWQIKTVIYMKVKLEVECRTPALTSFVFYYLILTIPNCFSSLENISTLHQQTQLKLRAKNKKRVWTFVRVQKQRIKKWIGALFSPENYESLLFCCWPLPHRGSSKDAASDFIQLSPQPDSGSATSHSLTTINQSISKMFKAFFFSFSFHLHQKISYFSSISF